MKKFSKNIAKEFKNSFGRFLAIMAIIALGVGFLIGVTQATPDMKTSMSDYLIENAAYDVDVKATYGLTQSDINNIASLKDDDGNDVVEAYMPVVTSSVMANIGGAVSRSAVNLIGLDFSLASADEPSENYLNRFTLIEGAFPAEGNTDSDGNVIPFAQQVVVERSNNYFETVQVGDKITLAESIGTDNSTYGDIYAQTEFTVVGIVSTPDYYYTDAREVTTIGTGVVSLVMYGNYVPDDAENSVYNLTKTGTLFYALNLSIFGSTPIREESIGYTDLWVQVADSEDYERFYTSYKDHVLALSAYST